eukprot:gene8569-11579_t
MEEDTPRSVGYGSPRDERFYTPRTFLRSNSSSDEWNTPRGLGGVNSDSEFITPRTFDGAERKSARGPGGIMYHHDDKQYLPPHPHSQQSQPKGSTRTNSINDGYKRGSGSFKSSDSFKSSGIIEEEENDFGVDMTGVSEKDVEDIFSFARHGRCEEIEKSLNKGIPVDVRDSFGSTLLIVACQNGNKRVAKTVLRRGANINARNLKGNTPLHYCYHYGYGDSLGQYLMEKGADPDIRNYAGKICNDGI